MLTEPHQDDSRADAGRVPVVVYVCTSDAEAIDLLAEYVNRYATSRDWSVIAVVTDADRRRLLADRRGWGRVMDLVNSGDARGVVTYSSAMVASDDAACESLRDVLGEQGAFLAVARAAQAAPCRSVSDVLRHRDLADAAANWHPDSPTS